jgi:hypothetical protein
LTGTESSRCGLSPVLLARPRSLNVVVVDTVPDASVVYLAVSTPVLEDEQPPTWTGEVSLM